MLLKCFEIIYYNSTDGTSELLKEYIRNEKILDSYTQKAKNAITELENLKNTGFIQLLKTYKCIQYNIFNNHTAPKLKYLLSANYSQDGIDSPYLSNIIHNITIEKTYTNKNNFCLPI